eukprot:5419148-Pyramimonas_sp.AAC.1
MQKTSIQARGTLQLGVEVGWVIGKSLMARARDAYPSPPTSRARTLRTTRRGRTFPNPKAPQRSLR